MWSKTIEKNINISIYLAHSWIEYWKKKINDEWNKNESACQNILVNLWCTPYTYVYTSVFVIILLGK